MTKTVQRQQRLQRTRRGPWWTVLVVALLLPAFVTSFLVSSNSRQHYRLQLTKISIRQESRQIDDDVSSASSSSLLNKTQDKQSNPSDAEESGGESKDEYIASVTSDSTLLDKLANADGLWNVLIALKEALYAKIYQIFSDIITIIKRSTQETEAWIREDTVGQLVSSALALITFYAAVAAFAVWNINLLNGNKQSWNMPNDVTVPTVRLPQQSTTSSAGITFQKPKWQVPKITTSYSNSNQDGKEEERVE